MKLLAITTPPRPQSDRAAARNVARRNAGRPSTVSMLANTTARREASVVAFRAASMAGMFWTFVDATQVADRRVVIAGPQGHHLARVLRVRPGERGVAVSHGTEYEIEVVEVGGGRVVARVVADRPVRGESHVGITLLQAALPNPDFDAVIEGGTAVGIGRFVAVQAERSVARPSPQRLVRWQAIAGSAAEQSHRGVIPEVTGPVALTAALREAGD